MVKAEMIVEIELHMNESDLEDRYMFPRFLLLRRPVGSDGGEGEEW